MTRDTGPLQSEDKSTSGRTTGLRSADGRWLLACNQRGEKDECVLHDLHRQYAARKLVLPLSSTAHTPPPLKHSFVMLTPQHPSLLQCRIQSPEPLRHVQVELVCSEHLELIGHCYDRQIDGQLFQKGGCARFCVNGQSPWGTSPIVRKHNDHQETRSSRRTAVWRAG